ncbi:MAG: uracil-DNA glycosylase [Deltaproteobacteria bacterium]|nr:uracil-DNA glycosylase [Deltaproteobacteria bacterium]
MHDLQDMIHEVRRYLASMKGLGLDRVVLSDASLRILSRWEDDRSGRAETLEDIQKDLGECRRCKLHEGRRHIVFGKGNPRARLLVVGEGPGFEEDVKGRPFVGPAGQLLTRILKAIHLSREEVYICNIIKCRPPRNRNPEPEEIAQCLPFLKRQIAAIRPALILALGTFAAQTLLETREPISRLRGRFFTYEGVGLMPTYHPAYLLRNPDKKRDTWADVQKLQAAYEKSRSREN